MRSGGLFFYTGPQHFDLAGNLVDETGVPSGDASWEETFGAPEWPIFSFSQAPRRAPVLECYLWQVEPGLDGRAAPKEPFKIKFRNPAYGHFPQWQPETLPAVKSADDLRVTIGPLADAAFGRQGAFGAWHTRFPLTVTSPRKGNEAWDAEVELSDATGNVINPIHQGTPYYSWWPGSGNYGPLSPYPMDGALWPGESAWRLKLFLKRSSGFPEADLVTFSHISLSLVPPAPFLYFLTNYKNGQPVVIGIGISTNTVTYLPEQLVKRETFWTVNAENPYQPVDIAMDVVALTADTGEKATASPGRPYVWQFPSQSGPRAESVPHNAKSVSVTVAVQKIRTVEFLVKPPDMRRQQP